jgi:hypothetical protein
MSTWADRIKAAIRDFGLEYFGRWYGWYPGVVTSVDDPDGQGRIKVRVPMLQVDPRSDEIPDYAYPMFGPWTPGPDKGSYNVPRVGDSVWVGFRNGNPSNPMYAPWGWYGQNERPSEFETTEDRGWKTHSGHVVRFRDADGDESILIRHRGGAKVEMISDDHITIETNAGDIIRLDSTGSILFQHRAGTSVELMDSRVDIQASQSVLIQSPAITLQGNRVEIAGPGAIHPLVKGDVLLTWLQALYVWVLGHTHISSSSGKPTGPSPASLGAPPPPPPPVIMNSGKSKTG